MKYEELISRDVKDLRVLAAQYSIRTHPRHKPETIAKLIIEHLQNAPKQQQMKHVAELPSEKPIVLNTEDQVREAIKTALAKPGFEAKFLPDNTWWFRCKGAEEAGHMSVPLRVIKMKADSVSVGARRPRMVDLGDGPIMAVG